MVCATGSLVTDSSGLCPSCLDMRGKIPLLAGPPSDTLRKCRIHLAGAVGPSCPSHSGSWSRHGADKSSNYPQQMSPKPHKVFPASCCFNTPFIPFSRHPGPCQPLRFLQGVSFPFFILGAPSCRLSTLSAGPALVSTSTYTGRLGTIEKIDRRKDHVEHFKF